MITLNDAPHPPGLEDRAFLWLVIAVSIAFAWIIWPFFGAVLWGTILAILFTPLQRRLIKITGGRPTLAAVITVLVILLIVILPLTLIGGLLIQEAVSVFAKFQSGEFNLGRLLQETLSALPAWVFDLIDRFGLTDFSAMQEKFTSGLVQSSQFVASKAINVGQNTFDLIVNLGIVLYLVFFFVRDGDFLVRRIRAALPLHAHQQRELFNIFTTVIRATVKGNLVLAMVQGALGAIAFWFLHIHAAVLWGVVMAFLSLLPAVGSALVWGPVAIYLIVTGSTWQGLGLIAFGVIVIGSVDNLLRPLLVGKDTKLPDYLVLISTLGGMAIFGLNGFVIGPVIAAMFISVWEIVAVSRHETPR